MQTSGIGSSHSDAHQVTTCIHNHKHQLEGEVQGAAPSASSTTQQVQSTSEQKGESFSLSSWLQNTLSGAKRLLGKIWGESAESAQGEIAETTHTNTLHSSQIEAASATVQPVQNYNNNPYFSAIEENATSQQSIWQKIKVRFQNITGFLTKRFSFSNSSSFQTKQERPKEDLRRHSRYREDDLEIDCILTDDSYLMDSYNKKGEYSKLSADK